jgi:hypothetical protein
MRVEPAGETGEQAGEHENDEPHVERADAQALDHGNAAAQAADCAALARVEQIATQQHDGAEQRPDE